MKKYIFILSTVLLFSCSITKQQNEITLIPAESNLTKVESDIVNEFLDIELKKERYKRYKDYEIVIIEEALKKMKSINAYLYSLDEWNTMNKMNKSEDVKNMYFLDTIQIKKIKNNLKDEEVYHWKVADFKKIKISLFKYEELIKTTNTGEYLKKKLIIYLSKPLVIDENNIFISFEIGNGDLGFNSITHFTVLMRKIGNKWVESGFYEDGVF